MDERDRTAHADSVRHRIGIICLLGGCLLSGLAEAKPRSVHSRASDFHLPTLIKMAERGEIAFIESTPEGKAKQVIVMALLDASPTYVWDVIMDVQAYPRFLKTVSEIEILGKKAGMTAFGWKVAIPFFTLEGTRLQRGKRPSLVETRGRSGNLRGTRERWELFSVDGGKRTLAALYRAIDVETGGLLLKAMVDLEPSMEQGTNLSTGFVHMRSLANYVAKKELKAPAPKTGPVPPFHDLELGAEGLDLSRLAGLLKKGQLALVESHPDGTLRQVALLTQVNAPRAKLSKIIRAPDRYPEFIPNMAESEVHETDDGKKRIEWEVEVPMSNLSGTSVMWSVPEGGVEIQAVSGDIQRGRWRWDLEAIDDKTTIPIHYIYSDVREASWVTEQIVNQEPLFEHGIVLASGTVTLTAMKARAEGYR